MELRNCDENVTIRDEKKVYKVEEVRYNGTIKLKK